ncbi:hypothetical protein SHKM778_32270 [Streptomyces sp. KM77-8]|uniref:AMP-dependent synthetase/ligase domain-containing protein n=1 Tax=Streptomyces haneummycinicus TaxID=3074435 RepID=A0AAT9HHE9_9ACTN
MRGEAQARGELVHQLLDDAEARAPHAAAVRDAVGVWDYRELASYSRAFAAWLHERGVRRGDRVVLQVPTGRELVAMFHGLSRCGAVFVPLNPAMKTFHLHHVLDDARPALVIGTVTSTAQLTEAGATSVEQTETLWGRVEELRSQGADFTDPHTRPDDVATLVYTSGSTAVPKAVVCPHAQVTFATRALTRALGYRADDVVLCRFPMSWDYGLYKVLMTCAVQCVVVLAERSRT